MKKKIYTAPHIQTIVLDYEISLALQSEPPLGPEEVYNLYSNPDITSTNNLLQEYI